MLAAGTDGGLIYVWETTNGHEWVALRREEGQAGSIIQQVVFDRDGRTLFSADRGGDVLVWDLESREVVQRLHFSNWVMSLALSPDYQQLVVSAGTPSNGGNMSFFTTETDDYAE